MNTTTNSKPIIGRGYWLRFLAVLLTLVMVMGTIPASAAKKTSSVEVSTKASLVKAIKKDGKATITLKTDKAVSIKIPSTEGSTTKKLVIDAPNASITNKTQFDTSGKTPAVTIKAVKYYTESVSGNTITLSGDGARINVSEKKTLKSLTVNGDNADICVRKKGKIENLTFKKKGATAKLEATNKSKVNVTLSKKTSLTVLGEKSADVNVKSSAKGSTVKASIPVDLTATKNTNFAMNQGAEGSTVDKSGSKVKVTITNKSKSEPVVTINGEAQAIATPKPTATSKPTATATPTTTPTGSSAPVIEIYDGGSSGGYSGGGSSSGGGYSGGGSSSDSGYSGGYTPAPTNEVTPGPIVPTPDPVTPTEEVTPTEGVTTIPTEEVTTPTENPVTPTDAVTASPAEEVTPTEQITDEEFDSTVKIGEITFPIQSAWTVYMSPTDQGNGVYLGAYMTSDVQIYMYESVAIPEKDFQEAISSKANFEYIGQLFVDELAKQAGATDPKVEVFDEDGVAYGKTTGSGNVQGVNMSFAIYFKLQDNNFIVTMAMEMSTSISEESDAVAFKACKLAKGSENTTTPTETVTPTEPPVTPTSVIIDEANFPDELFREFVKKQFDADKDGVLNTQEISNVKEIDCSISQVIDLEIDQGAYDDITQFDEDKFKKEQELFQSGQGMKTVKGIEFFISLEKLVCNFNQIEEIDLSKNTELVELNLEYNKLKELDISKNLKLKQLYCDNNALLKLDTQTNNLIETIYCFENQIIELDVSKNTELKDLQFGGNKVTSIDVSNNKKLECLEFEANEVLQLDISNNVNLEYLWCGKTNIQELDLSKNINLKEIHCKDTNITTLDVSNTNLIKENIICDENVIIIYKAESDAGMYYYEEGLKLFSPWEKLIEDGVVTVEENVITGINVDKAKGKLVIKDGIVGLSASSWDCKLNAIFIPKSFTSFELTTGDKAGFRYWENLEEIIVDPLNPVYDSRDNCNAIIDTATNTIVAGCKGTTFPDSVDTIGFGAFMSSNLEDITIPATIRKIESHAFWDCRNLKSVSISEGLEYIGDYAFESCYKLEEIMIPSTVSYIGSSVFSHNDSMDSIIINQGNSWYDSRYDCNAIISTETGKMIAGCKNTVIPDGVKIIATDVLSCGFPSADIYNIESIVIPASVEKIESHGISNINLKHIVFLGVTPEIQDRNFSLWDYDEYVYKPIADLRDITVPAEYLEAYRELLPQYADKIIVAEEKKEEMTAESYLDIFSDIQKLKIYINDKTDEEYIELMGFMRTSDVFNDAQRNVFYSSISKSDTFDILARRAMDIVKKRLADQNKYFTCTGRSCTSEFVSGHGCDNCDLKYIMGYDQQTYPCEWYPDLFPEFKEINYASHCAYVAVDGNSTKSAGGQSCLGFGSWCAWYTYSVVLGEQNLKGRPYYAKGKLNYDFLNSTKVRAGDVLRLNGTHTVVVYSYDENELWVLDCNNGGPGNCMVKYHKYSYDNRNVAVSRPDTIVSD